MSPAIISIKHIETFVFDDVSEKRRARTRTTTAAEELSQSIQVPSSTHSGTTYPVRAIPHSNTGIHLKQQKHKFQKVLNIMIDLLKPNRRE